MIEDQLINIIKRFKENQYYSHFDNKENQCLKQLSSNDQHASKQYFQKINNKIKLLQDTVERIVVDGNKMHRFYEEIIYQADLKFQNFKEEFNSYKCTVAQEKKQADNLVEFLNSKIQTLSRQIASKEQLYRDILEKYELLQEKANEVHQEGSQQVKSIESQLVRASMHHEEERIISTKQIQEMKVQMKEIMNSNEELLNQNSFIKSVNESLAHNIEYLKNRLYAQNNIIHEEGQQDDRLSMIQLQKCDMDSISREEDRFTLEEIKMNQSQELMFNGEKQVLDLSEHYSKFNRTLQFLSKQKENYQFIIPESNERKSFVKRQTLAKNEQLPQKSETISSKKQQQMKKPVPRQITQIKQFKMQQPVDALNPYKAFFMLLTQCQKLNSPYFDKISHLDLNYLYPVLVRNLIPYNLWQKQINKILKSALTIK